VATLRALTRAATVMSRGLSEGDARYLVLAKDDFPLRQGRAIDAARIEAWFVATFPGAIYRNPLPLDPRTARLDGVSVTPEEIVIALATDLPVATREQVRTALERDASVLATL
jgi:hypothetical protein